MEEGKVRAWYDKAVDIFYMLFEEGPSYEVVEVDSDVHLELDEKGKVIGRDLECWQARSHKAGGKSHSRISITIC
jgi:uncharacterized protein YuzE